MFSSASFDVFTFELLFLFPSTFSPFGVLSFGVLSFIVLVFDVLLYNHLLWPQKTSNFKTWLCPGPVELTIEGKLREHC